MEHFQNILFVKGSDHNEEALKQAVAVAKHNKADLTVADVERVLPDLSFYGFPHEAAQKAILQEEQQKRDALQALIAPYTDTMRIKTKVFEDRAFLSIVKEVLRNNRDLVIKPTEGHIGFMNKLFSSSDMALLRKCPCPVWLIKAGHENKVRKIVAAVDFDFGKNQENAGLNKRIVEMALSLAYREGAKLDIVHAWYAFDNISNIDPYSGMMSPDLEEEARKTFKEARQKALETLKEQSKTWVGDKVFRTVDPTFDLINGLAEEVITEQVKNKKADLLVMGTVGRAGIPGFFIGNTAESILGAVDCSVLALKPDGFVSPVVL